MRKLTIIFSMFALCAMLNAQSAKQLVKDALVDIENGLIEKAIEKYSSAIQFEPHNKELYVLRANQYLNIGDSISAAKDFGYVAGLGHKPAENYYKAASFFFYSNKPIPAKTMAENSIKENEKGNPAWIILIQIHLAHNNLTEAVNNADKIINNNNDGASYYYAGLAYYKSGDIEKAKNAFEKAIIKNENLLDAYLQLAQIQISQNHFQYAIDNCTYVLKKDNNYHRAAYTRSLAHHKNKAVTKSIDDITLAITLKALPKYFLQRGKYYIEYGQYSLAVQDLSLVIAQKLYLDEAFELRGRAQEKLGNKKGSARDYQALIDNPHLIGHDSTLIANFKNKVYRLNFEKNKPGIQVLKPILTDNLEIPVTTGQKEIKLKGIVQDENIISSILINNGNIPFDSDSIGHAIFETGFELNNSPFVTISATDIYGNTSTVTHAIASIEKQAPTISLVTPQADLENYFYVDNNDKYLYLEGYVNDDSKIDFIGIDKSTASFKLGDINPRFTATIDISNKKTITITAVDEYQNKAKQQYYILRGKIKSEVTAPMGKTWAVIIENSEYKYYSNLVSPPKDAKKLMETLRNYHINHIVHKKDLTKRELERFFAIDLRNLVKSNKVESLLVYYNGHGLYQNETGYWIPVDAPLNSEFDNYNINALKASLYSYTTLKHLLVVIDACHAGPSFNVAMKGPVAPNICSDTSLIHQKSFQAFTSTNEGYALDNSVFSGHLIETLGKHEFGCLSVDELANQVISKMKTTSVQEPVFGRIPGLKDENGTFFFYRK